MTGFKDFILRGNIVELAIGVIIGAAFSGVIDSMTKDLITPVIGMVGGQPDFSAIKAGPVALGSFLNAVISFLIKAAVVYFLIVKPMAAMMNRRKPAAPSAPPPPAPEVQLLAEIRDLLRNSAARPSPDTAR